MGPFGAGCDGSVPLYLQYKSWQAINPRQRSGTCPQGGQRFSPEAAKPKIMFFRRDNITCRHKQEPGAGGCWHRGTSGRHRSSRSHAGTRGTKPSAGQMLPAGSSPWPGSCVNPRAGTRKRDGSGRWGHGAGTRSVGMPCVTVLRRGCGQRGQGRSRSGGSS